MELKSDYLIMSLFPKKYGFDTIQMNIPMQLILCLLQYLLSCGGRERNGQLL